jgi:hypothetical protein
MVRGTNYVLYVCFSFDQFVEFECMEFVKLVIFII